MDTTVRAFHRVEPISREGDPGRGLAMPVHDPLWAIGRQRSFGELAGEDSGSPIQADFRMRSDPIDGWYSADPADTVHAYDPHTDVLDAVVAGESAAPAHSLRDRIDAGRRLRRVAPRIADAALATHPLPPIESPGRLAARAGGVYPDGLAVALLIRDTADDAALAAALGASAANVADVRPALDAFARWAITTFGMTPNTWIPERLERRFDLQVGGVRAVRAPVHTRPDVDAADLELTQESAALPGTADEPITKRVPLPLRFPGMPNDRLWEFEDAQLALHRIDAATHDLARLALVEFSSVYSNDWFTFPIPVRFSSVVTLNELVVRDVFGRIELLTQAADPAWSMFQPTAPAGIPQRVVVPGVSTGTLAGAIVEEVAFVRDENANVVWGLEKIITDETGTTRDLVAEYASSTAVEPTLPTDAELLYRLMTDVPEHWVPFIPVHLDAENRAVGLVQAVLPRPNPWGELVVSEPHSSVLRELRGTVLAEEEVPSDGVVVRRRWYLARSADGGRHVWAARDAGTGRGEGDSGLAFDITLDMRAPHG